jgi:hypothetical protein
MGRSVMGRFVMGIFECASQINIVYSTYNWAALTRILTALSSNLYQLRKSYQC